MSLFVFFSYVCLPIVLAIYPIEIERSFFFFTKLRFQIRINSFFNILTKLILNNLIWNFEKQNMKDSNNSRINDSLQFMQKKSMKTLLNDDNFTEK